MRRYRFIQAEKAAHPVAMMCRLLEVSRSGFYSWLDRGPSRRAQEDAALLDAIAEIHRDSRGTYGIPRIHAALADRGRHVGRKRVARLMGVAGLCGLRRPRRVRTTVADPDATPAPNVLNRDFTLGTLNRVWVADLTYIPTSEGWLFLATELDCCSRKIVGWSIADHMRTELPLAALQMALRRRRPSRGRLIHHSDRGSQYTSGDFQRELTAWGVTPSMSKRGDCYDNAVAESFFATLKAELVHRQVWATRAEARQAVFEWIEVFYNRRRLHSTLGYRSPEAFEREVSAQTPLLAASG